MKYKLINNTTGEEYLCEKVVIDGWDYYVSDELPSIGSKSVLQVEGFSPMVLTHFEECESDYKGKKLIATNNPNIDIPKVVDEVNVIVEKEFRIKHPSNETIWKKALWENGYNKSQETHPFSEEDMIEFADWEASSKEASDFWRKNRINLKMEGSQNKHKELLKELLQLWKEQKPKTLYYE